MDTASPTDLSLAAAAASDPVSASSDPLLAPTLCIDVYLSAILPEALRVAGMTISEQQLELFGHK